MIIECWDIVIFIGISPDGDNHYTHATIQSIIVHHLQHAGAQALAGVSVTLNQGMEH